jgi:ribosomal protein S18 acetylase RimI-like enzyme
MSDIRQMRDEDSEAIRRIEAEAFGTWWKQLTGQKSALPHRTHANILACREKDPQGCFMAEVEGRPVGFIFSRIWGNVGWFGTFSVLPEYQGRGIGKQLITASINFLRRSGVRVIGLETMPESPDNLGLYTKMGFRSGLLTFLLTKSLDNAAGKVDLPHWSSEDQQAQRRWIAGLRDASMQIPPGFDYSKEIVFTAQYAQGMTLVLSDDTNPLGMSTIWLQNQRQGGEGERAIVQVLMLHPGHTSVDAFRTLLQAGENLARAHEKKALTIAVNSGHTWAVQKLLEWGYRIERAMVRMVLGGIDQEPSAEELVNCSRWAG